MAVLQDFSPWVLVDCPGVPAPVLDDAVRRGCREFSRKTHAVENTSTINTAVGQQDYALPMTDLELLEVVRVLDATRPLDPATKESLETQADTGGSPQRYTPLETLPETLRLFPTPQDVRPITVRLAVMPSLTATTVDDRLYQWYLDGVIAYAKYWLMVQPNKPWSNASGGAFCYGQFIARADDARVRRSQARAGVPLSVQPRPIA